MTERVLVVPTAVLRQVGLFQGFTDRVEEYLNSLLDRKNLLYVPREQAEHDPEYKQLIQYVVLCEGGEVFHYRRGGGGEKRLLARRSVGIGGHVSAEDGEADEEAYRRGMWREVGEEVELPGIRTERCVGLINDDRTAVGQVHLGIVHVLELSSRSVRAREEGLGEYGFARLEELRQRWEEFETWSQILLEGDCLQS